MRKFLAVATGSASDLNFGPDTSIQEAVDRWGGRSIEAVPLDISAMPTHFSGMRVTDCTTPPANCNISWTRKLPRVVYDRILAENDFLGEMQQLIWESWKSELLAMLPFDSCVNCACNQATGFVCSMAFGKDPKGDKLRMLIAPALPVCNDLLCNARLRDFRTALLPKAYTPEKQMEACRVCSKMGAGQSIKNCGRCKTAFYCSRECQVKDWPLHKTDCRKFSKSERSLR